LSIGVNRSDIGFGVGVDFVPAQAAAQARRIGSGHLCIARPSCGLANTNPAEDPATQGLLFV
jgi:hypothetical protein